MNVRPLLLVMNPRQIPDCIKAISALRIDKVWLQNMWERELEPEIEKLVNEQVQYTHFILLSDDTIPTQRALDLVVAELAHHPVVTGYCNLDQTPEGLAHVNLCKSPLDPLKGSQADAYDWFRRDEVEAGPMRGYVHTYFGGACLTGMSRELWQRFPFRVLGDMDKYARGFASDWMLSVRLHAAKIPMIAPVGAFVTHVKMDYRVWDTTPERRLLNGIEPKNIKWDLDVSEPQINTRDMPSGNIAGAE